MIRNLDENHDWTFGAGLSNYVTRNQEVALNIKTRVLSFLGDCFFAPTEGIDWWHLMEYNKREEMENAVMNTIATTPDVTQINNIDSILNARRELKLYYDVETVYSSNLQDEIVPIV